MHHMQLSRAQSTLASSWRDLHFKTNDTCRAIQTSYHQFTNSSTPFLLHE